jgi:hypothetical protein
MRPKPKEPFITKEQRALWADLNDEIRELGGWTISEPSVFPLRFESEMTSQLPEVLRQCGHLVRPLGTHERLLPSTIRETRGSKTFVNQQVVPGIATVFEISLVHK